jgi:hypothetical protein
MHSLRSVTLAAGLALGHYTGTVSEQESGKATIPQDWLEEFEAAARRPLPLRFRYAFVKTYKPVLDDAPYRAFDTMADYRRWCEVSLPDWLGYGRV